MRKAALSTAVVALVAAAAVPPSTGAVTTHTVKFGEYFYRPARIVIRRGERVRFVNIGHIAHTVADSTKAGAIRARIIKPRPLSRGQSQTVRFTRRGTVYYVCTFHPSLMRGRIVVR